MGKRGRAPKGSSSQLLQLAENGKFEQFARSLVAQRVRIGKQMKGRTKPSNVREGLVRRSENEVVQKIDVVFPEEHVQCVFYVLDFLQPDGTPYFPQSRPIGADSAGEEMVETGVKEWTLEVISDEDSADVKMERKRELEVASASLYFKGGCAAAKALILESGEEALLKQRISFWWPYEQEWFSGIVDGVHASKSQSGRMTVLFDDGDTLLRSVGASIWRLESTEPTDGNKEASLVKALDPPSLQEAVRPHNLRALYNHSSVQDDKTAKRKREFAFILPDPVAAQDIQATITENGKVRVSVPIRTKT